MFNLRKKPCMSTFNKPLIAPSEAAFDMQGHLRVLQAEYLPKNDRETFYNMLDRYKDEKRRKVHDAMIFNETVGKDYWKQNGLRRNLTVASTLPPEKVHVARIRKSYEMHLSRSFRDYHGTFSPRYEPSSAEFDSPTNKKRQNLRRSQEFIVTSASPGRRSKRRPSKANSNGNLMATGGLRKVDITSSQKAALDEIVVPMVNQTPAWPQKAVVGATNNSSPKASESFDK